MRVFLHFMLLLLLYPLTVLAEGQNEPQLVSSFPLGGRQGSSFEIQIRGENLEGSHGVWFDCESLKELGARHSVPPHIKILGTDPGYDIQYHENFKAQFLGDAYDPMILPNPSAKDFAIPDLSIPESVTLERIQNRSYFLKLVDRLYHQEVESAEYSQMDGFRQQALNMILSPAVREGFDLSNESEKIKDAYGRDPFGQSVLLARRLVEAGCRFVTATDLRGWDTHGSNDERHGDLLVPALDQVL